MAITREVSTEKAMKGAVAVYEGGVYRNGESRCFQRSITRALGDAVLVPELHIDLVTEIALNELTAAGPRDPGPDGSAAGELPERPGRRHDRKAVPP